MRKYSKIFLFIFLLVSLISQAQARKRDAFEIYGDIFQFLPLAAAVYTLTQKDYEGLAQLAIGSGSVLATTFAIKYSFVGISRNHPNWAKISQRPDNKDSYEGFPSGHTSFAFSAAGFMQRRYGWQWGVPTTVLATLVGISRITSKRHSVTQVIAGAILGYGVSFLVSSKLDKNINIDVDVGDQEISRGVYQNTYGLSVSYRF
ncbi:phosphatase PAP2 family protein [Helicobacter cappadocius]|uniref:Phosphatase PAP2 family protein n=1 Tax=Helicobacter cappadocius TaxID=3063998 RepID=A0AA90PL58_9HELI|nr:MULTISPECIES: phosphatase PAP2 family protein [unclassified Helicobacter]MDO7253215.1 phosphatase PAP2 family protein [Helicobacter sp. faydin-H75]MDP2539139.1 phosphatase PAP2 family protein [Helicobacter sp. faydin-H76]